MCWMLAESCLAELPVAAAEGHDSRTDLIESHGRKLARKSVQNFFTQKKRRLKSPSVHGQESVAD